MSIIYFLQRADGAIKIGYTSQYKTRLMALRKQHGELHLLGAMAGSREEEAQLHDRFCNYRVNLSEFFSPSEELLEFIRVNATHSTKAAPPRSRLGLTITDEMEQMIKTHAEKQRRPLSEIVRIALERYLEGEGYEIKERLEWGGKREKSED